MLRFFSSEAYANMVEIETFIDSISVLDNVGKEVVMIVNTSISNNRNFYTDSNGLSLQKRVVDNRLTWDFNVTSSPIFGYL